MKYSLIQVEREYDGMVDGVWMQNHIGTIDSAAEAARATERANSNRITVAVVEDLGYSEPNHSLRTALKRLDIEQCLNLNNNKDCIHFIEKEPWYDNRTFIGKCDRYPVFMVKNNVEYFMFNRNSNQASWETERDESRKQQLLNNGGRFFRFHGYKDTPYEYLRVMIDRHHTFEKFSHKEVEWSENGMYCDFSGNSREVSAAFHYRIYDKDLASNVEKVVGLIHQKKYDEALLALNEYDKGQLCERTEDGNSLEDKIKNAQEKVTESSDAKEPEREER